MSRAVVLWATVAKCGEGKLAWPARETEMLCERLACDLRGGGAPSLHLAVERLRDVVGQRHGGALHTCILASAHTPWYVQRHCPERTTRATIMPSDCECDGKQMASTTPPKFTLRFESQQTHELLRITAEHLGTSMNALAEDMISRELQAIGLTIAHDLYGTLDLLQRHRGEDIDAGLAAFAQGEVEQADPLQARMVSQPDAADALGVAEAFS
jgi:hypothetical protein